jgi:hypothetical protein
VQVISLLTREQQSSVLLPHLNRWQKHSLSQKKSSILVLQLYVFNPLAAERGSSFQSPSGRSRSCSGPMHMHVERITVSAAFWSAALAVTASTLILIRRSTSRTAGGR